MLNKIQYKCYTQYRFVWLPWREGSVTGSTEENAVDYGSQSP